MAPHYEATAADWALRCFIEAYLELGERGRKRERQKQSVIKREQEREREKERRAGERFRLSGREWKIDLGCAAANWSAQNEQVLISDFVVAVFDGLVRHQRVRGTHKGARTTARTLARQHARTRTHPLFALLRYQRIRSSSLLRFEFFGDEKMRIAICSEPCLC